MGFKPRICEWCGKEFIPTSSRQQVCKEHIDIMRKEKRKIINRKRYEVKYEPKPSNLDEIARQARAEGLSYGQYQAQKIMENARVTI